MNFHCHQCLVRQLFSLDGRCRQLAFCPYCRVINKNSDTALSHMRKHLDLQFICGGCYSKSFLNGPALNKHMRTQCPSVTAIRDRSKSSRWWDSMQVPCQPHKAPGSRALGLLWGPLVSPPLDHTRLPRAEPGDIRPPGCGPYVGSSASSNVFTFVNLPR